MGFQALLLSFLIIYLIMHLYISIFTTGGVYKLACKIPDNVTVLSWYKPVWAYYHICLQLQAGLGGACVLWDWRDSQRRVWADPRDPGTQAASLLEASHGQVCSCTHTVHTPLPPSHPFSALSSGNQFPFFCPQGGRCHTHWAPWAGLGITWALWRFLLTGPLWASTSWGKFPWNLTNMP